MLMLSVLLAYAAWVLALSWVCIGRVILPLTGLMKVNRATGTSSTYSLEQNKPRRTGLRLGYPLPLRD